MPKKKASKAKAKKKTAKKTVSAKNAKKGKRYSDKRKADLLGKYNELRATGMTAQAAAKKVGVPYITLRSWEKKAGGAVAKTAKQSPQPKAKGKTGKKPGRPKGSKAAAAPKASKKGNLILVTPGGFRIEGISSKELVQVLKELR